MSNFLTAARFTDKAIRLPHQDAAWNWAWGLLTKEQQAEFLELFRAEPDSKLPVGTAWLAPALDCIKKWEGLRLEAYPDPGTGGAPWTIGYGATRYPDNKGPVRKGDSITASQAEAMLKRDVLELFGPGVLHLFPVAGDWKPNQIAALVSWGFNVGLGAVEDSTLRKRILDGEDACKVVREELPRWNKGGNGVLEGLKRRRAYEVKLFCEGQQAVKPPEVQQQPARLSPKAAFTMHMTPNIRLGEFALDQPERRFTAQHQVDTAAELACFLERVRRNFGNKPIIITSGYRPPAVNKACGGAANSEHLFSVPGEGAVDFYVDGADINAVQAFCDKYWPHSVGYGAKKGFVHLGRRGSGERRRWDY